MLEQVADGLDPEPGRGLRRRPLQEKRLRQPAWARQRAQGRPTEVGRGQLSGLCEARGDGSYDGVGTGRKEWEDRSMTSSPAVNRLALLAIVALAATALIAPSAGGAAVRAKVKCPQQKASFLYWPHGHEARPQAGFPAFPTPHLEIYGGLHDTTFPPTPIGYIDATGSSQSSSECTQPAMSTLTRDDIPHAQKIRGKAKNVQCKFGEKIRLVFSQVSKGARVDAVLGDGTRVVQVRMKNSGSSIVFNKRRCDVEDPPT
jgi:hypothetical protein